MRERTAAALALGDRLKTTARNKGMDVNKAASRHVAERVVYYLGQVFDHAPFVLKGGLQFQQHLRPTEDADIVTVRRWSNREVHNAFHVIAPKLASEGITLKRVSPEPQVIDLEYGEPVDRYRIEAECGTIRGNTHIDISTARGPDAWPEGIEWQTLPSMMKNGPELRVRCQPLEASAAEKWLAVLMQSPTDYRVRHMADLLSFDAMDLDAGKVAAEIERVARYRGIPLSVCAERPDTLTWAAISPRSGSWEKLRTERGFDLSLEQACTGLQAAWADVHRALRARVVADCRRPGYRPTLLERLAAGRAHEYRPAGEQA